jgi:serine/threonine protein kinase
MDKLKEKVPTANTTTTGTNTTAVPPVTEDRVKKLEQNFAGYLERTKDTEEKQQRFANDKAAKRPTRRFEEDSKSGKPFVNFYELGDVLGEGGYACVYRARHKRTNESYAVKDVNTSVLEKTNKTALQDEIAAMKLLRGGPHIIRLFDVFIEPDHTFMIMEEMKGGDLLTRISDKEVYTEREARKTCKILFEAMDYIHKKKSTYPHTHTHTHTHNWMVDMPEKRKRVLGINANICFVFVLVDLVSFQSRSSGYQTGKCLDGGGQ